MDIPNGLGIIEEGDGIYRFRFWAEKPKKLEDYECLGFCQEIATLDSLQYDKISEMVKGDVPTVNPYIMKLLYVAEKLPKAGSSMARFAVAQALLFLTEHTPQASDFVIQTLEGKIKEFIDRNPIFNVTQVRYSISAVAYKPFILQG